VTPLTSGETPRGPLPPSELRERARRLFERRAREWAVGELDSARLSLATRPPTEAALRAGFDGPGWVRQWRDAERTLPVTVRWVERRWASFGRQAVPIRVEASGPVSIAELAKELARWRRWSDRAETLRTRIGAQAADPGLVDATIRSRIRAIGELPPADATTLTEVVDWLVRNPVSGRRVRELPIRGIDTKWLERHRGPVEALVEAATGQEGLGLAEPATVARLRFLDPSMAVSGLSDLSAPIEELSTLIVASRGVLVVENLQTFLALPELPGVVALYGGGNRAAVLDRTLGMLPWARSSRVFYWGDLDSHGFAILDRARRTGLDVRSVLMDVDTLLAHRDLAVPEPQPFTGALTALTPAESDALALLREQGWLRLEQERIPWEHARARLLTTGLAG